MYYVNYLQDLDGMAGAVYVWVTAVAQHSPAAATPSWQPKAVPGVSKFLEEPEENARNSRRG